MTKKLMALLLAVLMAVSLLPMPAMAGDAQVITDLSGISAGGSYVVDKSVKDIVLSAPLTLNKDVTLELTGQTVTLKLADGESYADASVFHVESGSLTLKGSGTVKVPDNASGVVVAKDAAVTISGEVGISGGASGVKAVVGASGVKIRVNTLGKIESANGINLSGASGEIKIASGTVKGSVCAIAPDKDNALTLGKMLDGSTLYIGGTAATEEQLAAAPTAEMKELVFDDGKAPALTISSAVRTSETEGSVTFTASKAGTYYYQLDGEPASAADIMKDEAKAELVRGANTISLKDLDANAHTVYIAAKDAFGHTTELLTAAIPAVLAAPTAPVWDGKKAAWTGVEGVNDYIVQLYLGSDAYGDPIPVNGASATDDLSDVMKDDGVYTFAVRSVGANTVGAWSERSAKTVRDTAAPILTVPADGVKRTAQDTATVAFVSNEDGKLYYVLNDDAADVFTSGSTMALTKGEDNTLTLTGLADSAAVVVHYAAEDGLGNRGEVQTVTVPLYLAAPATLTWVNGTTSTAMWSEVPGAESYSIQLLRDGSDYGNVIVVNGGSTTTSDLAPHMNDDGVYTFRVRASAAGTQSEWSDVSATSYKRDTQKPTITGDTSRRIDAKTAEFSFIASEDGIYYYMVGLVNGDAPTAEQIVNDSNPHGGCTNTKTTIKLTDIPDTNAREVYLVVRDKSGNLSDVFTTTVPAYSAQPTPTPTPTPTPAPTTPPAPTATPLYLAAPTSLAWKSGNTAKWSEVPGAASYCVQLYKDGTEIAPAVAADTTSYTFTLEESGSYTFKVQAVNGDILSAWSEASGALAIDKTAPAVSGESASRTDASNGSVTFTSDEAGKVYYIVGGEKPTQDALLASANVKDIASGETKIDLSGLGAEATNVYLMVVDAAGNKSDIKTVKVPVYLAKPTTITWVNNTATAMWNAVSGAEAYNIQLLRDGNDYGNVIVVNGGSTTTSDLASHMNDDGVYTFRVQAAAAGTQSEWSDASATSYKRDTQKPTIKGEPSKRIDAKTAQFYFTSSEEGTYYYTVDHVNSGAPTAEQIANDKNPNGGCTNVRTTITLKDIADTNARKVYVVVRDKSGNLSEVFTITVPAYSAQPTPTPTPAPTATPTSAPTTYTVTLQGGTGYTIAATGGSKSPVNAGGSFSFTVTPSNGYTRGNGFSVKANGTTLTSNNGVYTISNINANQTVSVSGIVKRQNTGGGTLPAAPAITTTTLAAATMGKEYRQQITATGGTPITWSYSGTLPDGMTLAANTGILSGTPTQEGSFRFAVKATNSTGFSTRQMTLVVAGSEYTVTKGANSEWTQGGDKGIEFSGSGKGTFTVKVDGAAVAAGKYTASADGSTVTLKPEYLDTLAAGSHTVTLVYGDGSAKAKFTIKAKDKTVAPTVSSQPASASVNADSSATFTVTASGTTPLLCQWQVDKNDGSGWTDISGAVNASYTVEKVTAEQNGWKYRCVIKNAAGSVESNAATLTVKEAIGDVKKNDDTKDTAASGGLGRILLITGIIVAVLALGAGLYFYFRRRSASRYTEDDTAWRK